MTRQRGKIICIGGWDLERDVPVGWVFASADVGLHVFSDGRPTLMAGFTVDELRAIYRVHIFPDRIARRLRANPEVG